MNHKTLTNAHKNRYLKAKEKVELILEGSDRSFALYKKEYESELRKIKKTEVVSPEKVFEGLALSEVVLVGDFHAEAQSIRSFLRICRSLPKNSIVLALECLSTDMQRYIDLYLNGEMSENKFLHHIKWSEKWGFPFKLYRPLFRWAIDNKIPIFGVNFESVGLKKRDYKMAQFIYKLKSKFPEKQILMQVGDYHLAQSHLPLQIKKIKKNIKLSVVFQSPDDVYFKWSQKHRNIESIDFLKIGPNKWCVFSVLPWIKWENYLINLEQVLDVDAESFDFESDDVDLLDYLQQYVEFLGEVFNFEMNISDFEVIQSKSDFLKKIRKLNVPVKKTIVTKIEGEQVVFIPEIKVGYAAKSSANHLGQLAAYYFLNSRGILTETLLVGKDHFLQNIWVEMLVYFLSKLSNPKRKTATLFDVRSYLKEEHYADHGKEVLNIALEQKLNEMRFVDKHQKNIIKSSSFLKKYRSNRSLFLASQILGRMLGEKVYFAFVKKMVNGKDLERFLFQVDLLSESFPVKYYESIETIDSWPLTFKSKFDQF